MTDLSIPQALGAGFRLIARRPLAPLLWGVAYFVIGMVPILLVLLFGAGAFVEMLRQIAANPNANPNDPSNPLMAGMVGPMALLQPVSFLSSVAAQAIVMNAVFRAVLEPEDNRFFYLRVGATELWQALVQLCLRILLTIAAVIAIFAVAAVGGVIAVALMAGGVREFHPWMAVAAALVVVLVVAVMVWIWLRLSMAGPMTFHHKTFRLFESWTLTRGHAGSLFLLALAIVVVVVLIEIVVFGLIAVATVLLVGGMAAFNDDMAMKAFFDQPSAMWLPVVITIGVVVCASVCLFSGFLFALVLAPWADAYRQLSRGEAGVPPLAEPAPVVVQGA